MALFGDKIKDTNVRLRFYLFCFVGIAAFASILYWRTQLMYSQEYVEFHRKKTVISKPLNQGSARTQTDQLRKELSPDGQD